MCIKPFNFNILDQFLCEPLNKCINDTFMCDGIEDCPDGQDEFQCK